MMPDKLESRARAEGLAGGIPNCLGLIGGSGRADPGPFE
jgi:hypothetical protein